MTDKTRTYASKTSRSDTCADRGPAMLQFASRAAHLQSKNLLKQRRIFAQDTDHLQTKAMTWIFAPPQRGGYVGQSKLGGSVGGAIRPTPEGRAQVVHLQRPGMYRSFLSRKRLKRGRRGISTQVSLLVIPRGLEQCWTTSRTIIHRRARRALGSFCRFRCAEEGGSHGRREVEIERSR